MNYFSTISIHRLKAKVREIERRIREMETGWIDAA